MTQSTLSSRLIDILPLPQRIPFYLAAVFLLGLCHGLLPVIASDSDAYQDQNQSGQYIDPDQASAAALEHTRRLSRAMEFAQAPSPDDQVEWIDLGGRPEVQPTTTPPPTTPRYKPSIRLTQPVKPQQNPPPANDVAAPKPPVTTNMTTAQPSDLTVPSEDTRQLLENLRRSINNADNPEVFRAVATASLNLVDPDRKFGPENIAGLDPFRQKQILRFNQIVASVGRQLSAGKDPFAVPPATTPQAVATDPIDMQPTTFQEDFSQEDHSPENNSLKNQPIEIRLAQLCTRVRGYGVYDPIEGNRFIIGRNQRMIVYVELDHFRSVQTTSKTGKPQFQVKLNQEITLYNNSDGYEVWRYPKVEIVDKSRNQRRDFFLVQMVDLPQKLSIGQYILKIRVIDVAGACRDEMSVPIYLLGDESQALTSGEQ